MAKVNKKKSIFSKNPVLKWIARIVLFIFLTAGIIYGLVYFEIFSIQNQTLGELIVTLQSSAQSINVNSGDSANITFFMRALGRGKCITECDISFTDISNNLQIHNEKISLSGPLQEYVKSYELVAPKYGEGQVIYNFNARCQNVYSKSCTLNNTVVRKTEIITLNYKLSSELQQLKPLLKQNLENLLNNYSHIEITYRNLKLGLDSLNLPHNQTDLEFQSYQQKITALIDLWNQQKYGELGNNLNVNFSNLSKSINESFQPIREFNSMVLFANQTQREIPIVIGVSDSFSLPKEKVDILKAFSPVVESLSSKNLNLSRSYKFQFEESYNPLATNVSLLLDSLIFEKNITSSSASANSSITQKFNLLANYCNESAVQTQVLEILIGNESNGSNKPDKSLAIDSCQIVRTITINPLREINLTVIPEDFNLTQNKFNLGDNPPICCMFGKCSVCCVNSSCGFNPLILVHGHLFNEKNSPDYSVIEFELIQNELEKNGYVNAGTITPDSSISEVSAGEWGLSGNSMSITATYYRENEKNLSISDYAANLNNEIKLIQYRTGQKKVDIVAYSMGGLVVRAYLQKYGEDSINKMILVAVPNNGTSGKINTLCPIFGSSRECTEMQEGNAFLNNLNSYQPKNLSIYNFIGSGCLMDNKENGDGIVMLKNAMLRNEFNAIPTFKINGNCPSSTDLLHVSMINVEKHPEVFSKIIEILKTN